MNFDEIESRKSRTKSLSKAKIRPMTPHIDLINIRTLSKADNESNIYRNFHVLVKQIIETQNTNFLNGEINIIEYLISKYSNIPRDQIKNLDKLSLKINSDFGLLNQFGYFLPNLVILKLNNSIINDIAEIGASFKNLKVLHVSNCNLNDLSGCFI